MINVPRKIFISKNLFFKIAAITKHPLYFLLKLNYLVLTKILKINVKIKMLHKIF